MHAPLRRGACDTSETKLNSQLYVALARLGEHAAEVGAARIDDDAIGAAAGGVAEVRVIDEIEGLQTELHTPRPAHREVLEEGDVPVLEARAAQAVGVAAGVAERPVRGPLEGRRVEPEVLIHGTALRELGLRDRRIADEVPRLRRGVTDARVVVTAPNRQGCAGLEVGHTRDLPAAEELADQGVLLAPEGQLVDVVDV